MAKGGLTSREFWKRAEALARSATMRGATFAGDTAEKKLRRRAEAVVLPERFNAHYLPNYFRQGAALFHLAMYRLLERYKRACVRAPRGHAKSTVITFAYTLHQVACGPVLKAWVDGSLRDTDPDLDRAIREVMAEELMSRWVQAEARVASLRSLPAGALRGLVDQLAEAEAEARFAQEQLDAGIIPLAWDPYIQIIAVTDDLATEFTAAVKLELERNDLLRSDWGELAADTTGDGDYVINDIRVKAFGMEAGIRGGKHGPYRPTLAIVDDPDSKRTVATLELRNKAEGTLSAEIEYGLEPSGRIFMAGTSLHEDCLVRRVSDRERYPEWTIVVFLAIQEDGTALWEQRWPIARLRRLEQARPDFFATEMMDRPPTTGGKPFHTLVKYARAEHARPLPKVLWFDPSLGRTEKSDFQALVVLRGPTKAGLLLVHRVELLRIGDPAELVARINQVFAEEQPDLAGIEAIGFQSLFTMLLTSDGVKRGLFSSWHQIEKQTDSKDLRIRGMAPLINGGTIRFPDDGSCRLLEQQLLEYPAGKKDGPDALEMALRQMRQESVAELAGKIRHIPGRAAGFGEGRGVRSWDPEDVDARIRAARGCM